MRAKSSKQRCPTLCNNSIVTYNNFECLSYKLLQCSNVYVTALLVLPPFYFRMFEIIPF